MGFFDIFKKKQDSAAADIPESRQQQQEELNAGLEKTKTGIFSKLARAVAGRSTVDADLLDDVEEVLDFYFKACSISVTSQDLAVIGSVLSSHGTLPDSEERVFDREQLEELRQAVQGFLRGEGPASYQQEFQCRRLLDQITAQLPEKNQDQMQSESQKLGQSI